MKQIFSLAAVGNPELPPNNDPNLRWVAARKLAVVLHVLDEENGALKSIDRAIEHYSLTKLSRDELEEWIGSFTRSAGNIDSLKTTKIRQPAPK